MVLAFLLFLHSFLNPTVEDNYGKIRVEIKNVEEVKGNIALLLFNQEDGFPDNDKVAVMEKVIEVKDSKPYLILDSLPFGTYAIALIHDVNANDEMDANMIGIPREPFGMSNITSVGFTRPTFQDASFLLDQKELTLAIDLLTIF